MLDKTRSRIPALAAAVVIFSLPVFGQSPTPAASPETTAPAQALSVPLPDAPSPSASSPPPQKQTPSNFTVSPTPTRSAIADTTEVTILENTPIRTMTEEPVSTGRARQRTKLLFTVTDDVMVGDVVAIPRGATVRGTVIAARKAGVLTGSPQLTLELTELELGGRTYPLYTYKFQVTGLSKTRPTETDALRGAYVGALLGAMSGSVSAQPGSSDTATGRAASMTAGAVVGAGVGTAVSAVTPGPGIRIPAEAQVNFTFNFTFADPITITPVSAQEAARLAQGLLHGGPVLYVRGETP